MSDGKETNCLEGHGLNVVIVGASKHISRVYYEGEYKEDKSRTPDCYSIDGIKPSKLSTTSQAKVCYDCEHNVKGSGPNNSRACKFQQRIAVVLETDIGGDVYQLNIPSRSIFGKGTYKKLPLQAYCKKIAENNAPITSVVTEMYLNLDNYGVRITFRPIRILDNSEFDIALKQTESLAVNKIISDANDTHTISLKKEDIDLLNENNFTNLAHVMGMIN